MDIGKWKMAQAWIHHPEPKNSRGVWDDLVKVANAEWETKERDQMAQGGTPQLVQPGPGRPGYSGNIARTPEGFSKEQIKISRNEITIRAKKRDLPKPNFDKYPGKGYPKDTG